MVSIGLHGLVLALPMPNLVEEKNEPPEPSEPEVIQVVTLPKLATAPDSLQSPVPEPAEPLPVEPPTVEEAVEDIVIADPEILDELEPEPEPLDDSEWEDNSGIENHQTDLGNGEDEATSEPTLDQRLASLDSYSNFDGTRVGDTVALSRLGEISQQGGLPSRLRDLERALSPVTVPLQECLDEAPGDSVSVMVEVGPDGMLSGDPELLNSSGYDVLDEKVLATLREANYAAYHSAGESKLYSFAIQIDYAACNVAGLANTKTSG
ncbi:hypothetical protein N836_18005 [Leptolyngbya sp. Heron Island J]|nr:hypothetical protein N836_18005 [Leptolyngbya sp. Heron Island J]